MRARSMNPTHVSNQLMMVGFLPLVGLYPPEDMPFFIAGLLDM